MAAEEPISLYSDWLWGEVADGDRPLLRSLEELFQSDYVQRLGKVKQLGLMNRLVPECSHSRLDHSIGAIHVGLKIIERIENQLDSKIPGDIRQDLLTAILLHDTTHYPLSHATERALVACAPGIFLPHKRYLRCLIELIRKDTPSLMSEESAERIDWILRVGDEGPRGETQRPVQVALKYGLQPWHRQIVAGAIDADRLDYIPRDWHHLALLPVPTQDIVTLCSGLIDSLCVATVPSLEVGGSCDVLALDSQSVDLAARFLILRCLLYCYGYFSPQLRGFEGAYILMLKLLNDIRPLAAAITDVADEEAVVRFLMRHNDEEFLDWLEGAYEDRIGNETNPRKRRFLQETYHLVVETRDEDYMKGFTLCDYCDFDEIRPYFLREIGHWSGWRILFDHVERILDGYGAAWIVMPDVLSPEHDETEEFYVRGTRGGLSRLSSYLSPISRLFDRRLSRVDFYVSPMTNDAPLIRQFVRETIKATLCVVTAAARF